MTETYTIGSWIVKDGEEDAFIAAWTEFATWAIDTPGLGAPRLIRDLDRPNRFKSFAAWESFEAQEAWKMLPEFQERLGRVRAHCEELTPTTYELVAQVG